MKSASVVLVVNALEESVVPVDINWIVNPFGVSDTVTLKVFSPAFHFSSTASQEAVISVSPTESAVIMPFSTVATSGLLLS